MPTFPPVADQLALIRRGIEKIVPEDELAPKLEQSRKTGTPLRIKYGIDPTGIDVHLGHTVPLRKLRQFQELGHQAVLIIGNYTALVGDPSGRDAARTKKLTEEDVERNARDYLVQVGKVIDLSRTEIHRNGDWFAKMTFAQVLGLCGKVTVAQMLTRDDFAKRYASNTPIFLHECLYPLMQGWDSVEIKSDVELGGTEQLYSFMLARDLQREQSLPQQIGVMSPILVGTDGVRRMGKSLGNYIGIGESPYDMMKKFMQIPDGVMRMYFELLTNIALPDVEALLAGHPKDAKVRLAKSVIAEYHNATAADEAADRWQREIGGGGLPDEIPTLTVKRSDLKDGQLTAAVLLKSTGLCDSTSDARRLIAQGGASTGPEKTRMTSYDQPINIIDGLLVWAGKKKFGKVELQD
jgi:tyrosyl-tRNA synthetase